jgi:hypothetical protein
LAFAQAPTEEAAKDDAKEDGAKENETADSFYAQLPDPLDKISGNMEIFEENGLFRIDSVKFGPGGDRHEDAVVWTLRANRSITFRHVGILLRNFRDVRFYAFGRNAGRPILSKLLYYSPLIEADAINGEVLPKDGPIEVWLYIDRVEVRRLVNQKADTVVFRRRER